MALAMRLAKCETSQRLQMMKLRSEQDMWHPEWYRKLQSKLSLRTIEELYCTRVQVIIIHQICPVNLRGDLFV